MLGSSWFTDVVSAGSMPLARTYHVIARYIAPVLIKVYPRRSAMSLATVDFPDAAGPSMAMAGCVMSCSFLIPLYVLHFNSFS